MIDSSTIKEMIRRVFLPLPMGEGVGGRGRRGLGGEAIFLFIFLFSCSPSDVAPGGSAYCPVRFTLGGITAESSSTRASEALADGATVRVVAYKRSGPAASLTAANYLAECTYRVTNGGKALTPCAVNSDGSVNTGAAAPKELTLIEGTYDFYAVTPALAVDHTGSQPTVSVGHGADFAVSQSSASVSPGAAPVALNTLERRCAQLRFRTDRTGTAVGSLTVEKLTLTAMATTPKTVTGTGAPAATTGSVQVDVPGSAFTGSGYEYSGQTVVLPKGSAAFTLKATVRFNGSDTAATFEETVAATALEAGKSYGFVLKFNGYGMEVKQEEAWKEIANGDEEFGALFYDLNVGGKTANCYIVTGNENGGRTRKYSFDATKPGNDSDVPGITKPTNLATATEARVLWQTGAPVGAANAVVKSVEYDETGHLVRFTTGTATEGNAVIGIFASSAEDAPCLWSWHIWRLPSAPGTKTFNKTSATTGGTVAVTMLDRNLGAYNNNLNDVKAIGLLYQWGRKDPFPGPAGFNRTEPGNIYGSLYAVGAVKTFNGAYTIPAVKSDATTGTLNYAIQYPGAFLYAGPSTDWLQTKDNNLWGTPWEDGGTGGYNKNQGTKTIYDPCPPGFRVPPQDTWNLQTTIGSWSNGMTMDKLGNFWFSAAGIRWGDSDAGRLTNGGSQGCYWSSSPYGTSLERGGNLSFVSGYIGPQNINYRAHGLSVRCVTE